MGKSHVEKGHRAQKNHIETIGKLTTVYMKVDLLVTLDLLVNEMH